MQINWEFFLHNVQRVEAKLIKLVGILVDLPIISLIIFKFQMTRGRLKVSHQMKTNAKFIRIIAGPHFPLLLKSTNTAYDINTRNTARFRNCSVT